VHLDPLILLWLAGSGAFSVYVSSFARLGRTHGSLAGIVVLLLWLLVSAYSILVGAEVSAELERRHAAGDRELRGGH